jgi:glycosyltransferase involved in cell wall biosynthesis
MQLHVYGWRNISHSFCLVNQHQLVCLMNTPGLSLSHEDAPYTSAKWDPSKSGAGFAPDEQARIDALGARSPGQGLADWSYEIAYPFFRPSTGIAHRRAHFIVTSFGFARSDFVQGALAGPAQLKAEDIIITPSQWAREKILRLGFPEPQVKVVHHGVDLHAFYPVDDAERQALRASLGLSPDDVCFLNVGAMTINKSIDLVIHAFARVHKQFPQARLLLKDQSLLYGISAQAVIQNSLQSLQLPMPWDFLERVSVISQNLSLHQLRGLLNSVDCYLSPYRAEGFNLPVLESLACGTPVLVTEGGPTDEFVFSAAGKVAASRVPNRRLYDRGIHEERLMSNEEHLEPDLESLVERMTAVITGKVSRLAPEALAQVQAQFSWEKVTADLMSTLQSA